MLFLFQCTHIFICSFLCVSQVIEDVAGYEFRAVVSAREVFVTVAVDEVITAVNLCKLGDNLVFVSAEL